MNKVNAAGLTEKQFLEQYCPGNYERPSVTVDIMVLRVTPDFERLQVLLIQRKNHPFIEQWALPGGFISMNESAYEAALRELEEETDIKNVYLEQVYTMSRPDRDPRMRVIDIAYMALLPFGTKVKPVAGDDAKEALWFDILFTNERLFLENKEKGIAMEYNLEKHDFLNGVVTVKGFIPHLVSEEALAFDHSEIITEGLMRIRNKVMYSDIAFNLVQKQFTLPDLQKVYELILGKQLFKKNFRKKAEPQIHYLNKKGKTVTSNKMSELYEYSPKKEEME